MSRGTVEQVEGPTGEHAETLWLSERERIAHRRYGMGYKLLSHSQAAEVSQATLDSIKAEGGHE